MNQQNLTFDERARQAAAGVKEAVDSADLQLFAAGIPALRTAEPAPRGFRWSDRWVAAAGAFAAIIIVVGIALLPGRLFAPDGEVAATTQPTVPDSVVLPSNGTGGTDGTVTTIEETTTTTQAEGPTTVAADTTPPELNVISPEDGATVSGEQSETGRGLLQFHGTTEVGAKVIAAGQWEADVAADGSWEIILGLNSGSNIVEFTAIDEAGNETKVQLTVIYEPPAPTTTTSTTEPEQEPDGEGTSGSTEFTATAQFGECAEIPPYDVYWGTAPAGAKVTISSEYGGGTVYADETGNWEIRVEFPEAPTGVEFPVTVTHVETGQSKVFGFISLAEG